MIRFISRDMFENSIIRLEKVLTKMLVLETNTDYCFAPELFANKFIYLKFHPKTRELIVHDGSCAKVYADGNLIYSYELLDSLKPGGKKFGGDTHGAIVNTKDSVFFGGFAFADVSLDNDTLTFINKYSHIHKIGPDGREINLVWYDGPGTNTSYVGEVTDMLYSPKDEAIYFTRGDGGYDIWKLDLNTMYVSKVTNIGNVYKMELYDDIIITGGPTWDAPGYVVLYDLKNNTTKVVNTIENRYLNTFPAMTGQVVQYMNSIYVFGNGGVCALYPKFDYDACYMHPFFRFNYNSMVVGKRSQKVYIGGIPIVAVNVREATSIPYSPAGLLMKFDPIEPQIIMTTGFVTGLETDGKYLYVASAPNNHIYYRPNNVVNYEPGRGGIFAIPVSDILGKPITPVVFNDEVYNWDTDTWYLGVPISGFSKKILKVKTPSSFTLRVVVYPIFYKPNFDQYFEVDLSSGWNTIDLSSYEGIVAVSPKTNVNVAILQLILEP
jgi:hypothetical protein